MVEVEVSTSSSLSVSTPKSFCYIKGNKQIMDEQYNIRCRFSVHVFRTCPAGFVIEIRLTLSLPRPFKSLWPDRWQASDTVSMYFRKQASVRKIGCILPEKNYERFLMITKSKQAKIHIPQRLDERFETSVAQTSVEQLAVI